MKTLLDISFNEANNLFNYDPINGKLYWKKKVSIRIQIGNEAGTISKTFQSSYRIITINYKFFKTHRIIWLLETGKMPIGEIDHIDGNGLNNRFQNLRECNRESQSKNMPLRADNKSGYTGISWAKQRNSWNVKISKKNLGYFKSLTDAVKAREIALGKYDFHPNHGRSN